MIVLEKTVEEFFNKFNREIKIIFLCFVLIILGISATMRLRNNAFFEKTIKEIISEKPQVKCNYFSTNDGINLYKFSFPNSEYSNLMDVILNFNNEHTKQKKVYDNTFEIKMVNRKNNVIEITFFKDNNTNIIFFSIYTKDKRNSYSSIDSNGFIKKIKKYVLRIQN